MACTAAAFSDVAFAQTRQPPQRKRRRHLKLAGAWHGQLTAAEHANGQALLNVALIQEHMHDTRACKSSSNEFQSIRHICHRTLAGTWKTMQPCLSASRKKCGGRQSGSNGVEMPWRSNVWLHLNLLRLSCSFAFRFLAKDLRVTRSSGSHRFKVRGTK